jgi:hypothetical protein
MFVGHNFIEDKMLNKKALEIKKDIIDNNLDEIELEFSKKEPSEESDCSCEEIPFIYPVGQFFLDTIRV